MFIIRLGVPEMKALWDDLANKAKTISLTKAETALYKKWGKAMAFLANNPKHPGLQSHEIDSLSRRYGTKVWQSYRTLQSVDDSFQERFLVERRKVL